MKTLPDRANLEHLKKQAKDLLRAQRSGDPGAAGRFRAALPAAMGRSPDLRLRDAQSCIAREYGFASWADLAAYVGTAPAAADRAARLQQWLELVYTGDVIGRYTTARPRVAIRMLAETPDLTAGDPYLACAVADERALEAAARDPAWINRPGGPLRLPPLVALTHSTLVRAPELRDRFHRCARRLLAAGADPNGRIGRRWPPASLAAPDDGAPLSALYGAAGSNYDPELTELLLAAGADPNDGESLYHSLENLDCARLLLRHGARTGGTNALYRALDLADPGALELLLAHGADPNEPARTPPLSDWGAPLLWAIRRRRSLRHVEALLAAGADPAARTPGGVGAYRLANRFGLSDVAGRLARAGGAEALPDEEQFAAACARGDEAAARAVQARRPDLPGSLPASMARLLPDTVAEDGSGAATLMVRLGWPVAARGGDWDTTALNLAVFRGDAGLAAFLLEHGASWRETHGYGGDVCGTLSWASCNEPVATGDWAGCARALLAHGMPGGKPDGGEMVSVDGRPMPFPEDVREVLLGDRVFGPAIHVLTVPVRTIAD